MRTIQYFSRIALPQSEKLHLFVFCLAVILFVPVIWMRVVRQCMKHDTVANHSIPRGSGDIYRTKSSTLCVLRSLLQSFTVYIRRTDGFLPTHCHQQQARHITLATIFSFLEEPRTRNTHRKKANRRTQKIRGENVRSALMTAVVLGSVLACYLALVLFASLVFPTYAHTLARAQGYMV